MKHNLKVTPNMEIIFDNYEHLDPNCMYIVENIETASTEGKLAEMFTEGCKCAAICSENSCTCIERSGAHYIKSPINDNNKTEILCGNSSDKPIYECNSSCKCITICGNRLAQFGPRPDLEVVKTEAKGFGLITLTRIEANVFICEYAGELLSLAEAETRQDLQLKNCEMNYIMYVKEHFGETEIISTIIDPSKFGNIGRYINHSCKSNCEIIPIRVHNDVPKLCVFTKGVVAEKSELTYDYGDGNLGFKITNEDSLVANKIACLCGEQGCRKYLPFCMY